VCVCVCLCVSVCVHNIILHSGIAITGSIFNPFQMAQAEKEKNFQSGSS